MKTICCGAGVLLIWYALNIAKDTGSTAAIILGAIGVGLLLFSDYKRS